MSFLSGAGLRAGTKHSRASLNPRHARETLGVVGLSFSLLSAGFRFGFTVPFFRVFFIPFLRLGPPLSDPFRADQGWRYCNSSISWKHVALLLPQHAVFSVRACCLEASVPTRGCFAEEASHMCEQLIN